jgi:phospholipid/cholesterol/gamma-HCH transport system substrate-binding protein
MRRDLSLPVRVGIALVMVAAIAATLLYVVRSYGSVSGTPYSAVFGRSGQGLDASSAVKIRGVTVGGISSVTLNAKGRAVVTLHLDPGVKVPGTTTASIEPVSVFGPKFVNLILGAGEGRGPYLPAGAMIAKTQDPTDLSNSLGDAYGALSAVDPGEVTTIVHTLGRGLDGKGQELRGIVDNGGKVVDVAYRHRADAQRFLGDTAALADSLGGSGGQITGIAQDVNVITPDLLARADKVRALLAEMSTISGLAAHGLRKHREDLRAAVTSGERAASVIYAQLGLAGNGVRGLTTLLGVLNKLITAKGPGGYNQLNVEAFVATDLCELFVGACGATNGR